MKQLQEQHTNSSSRRRGFTLVELIVGITVSSLLVVGLSSSLSLSLKGVDQSAAPQSQQLDTHELVGEISSDLRQATSFSERTTNAVTISVPDRDGDGSPETIRYAWSGTAGDPLTRQLNQNTAVTIAENVNNFDLEYLVRTMTGTGPSAAMAEASMSSSGGSFEFSWGSGSGEETQSSEAEPEDEVESLELVLCTSKGRSGVKSGVEIISSARFFAQQLSPVLPTNTLHYTITRVEIHAIRAGNADGILTLGISKYIKDQDPTDAFLEQKHIWELSLPKGGSPAHSVSFNGLVRIPPDVQFFLMLKGSNSAGSAYVVRYTEGDVNETEGFMVRSEDGGTIWSQEAPFEDLSYTLYGKVTTEGPAEWD